MHVPTVFKHIKRHFTFALRHYVQNNVFELNVHENAGPDVFEIGAHIGATDEAVVVWNDHALQVVEVLTEVVSQKPANQGILK